MDLWSVWVCMYLNLQCIWQLAVALKAFCYYILRLTPLSPALSHFKNYRRESGDAFCVFHVRQGCNTCTASDHDKILLRVKQAMGNACVHCSDTSWHHLPSWIGMKLAPLPTLFPFPHVACYLIHIFSTCIHSVVTCMYTWFVWNGKVCDISSARFTHNDHYAVTRVRIHWENDYIIGLVTPAIGPHKSKELTWHRALVHNIRVKV